MCICFIRGESTEGYNDFRTVMQVYGKLILTTTFGN